MSVATGRRGRFGDVSGALALLLTVLALVSQLVVGSLLLPDEPPSTRAQMLSNLSVICHPGTHPHPHPQVPHHDVICTLVDALTLPALLVASGPAMPRPILAQRAGFTERPPSRAPPPRRPSLVRSRAPPTAD